MNCPAALTWHWQSVPADAGIKAYLEASMNAAVATWNTMRLCRRHPSHYNSGVPTAQTDGMGGLIEFGGSQNYARRCMRRVTGSALARRETGPRSRQSMGRDLRQQRHSILRRPTPRSAVTRCTLALQLDYDSEQAYPSASSAWWALRRDMGCRHDPRLRARHLSPAQSSKRETA